MPPDDTDIVCFRSICLATLFVRCIGSVPSPLARVLLLITRPVVSCCFLLTADRPAGCVKQQARELTHARGTNWKRVECRIVSSNCISMHDGSFFFPADQFTLITIVLIFSFQIIGLFSFFNLTFILLKNCANIYRSFSKKIYLKKQATTVFCTIFEYKDE